MSLVNFLVGDLPLGTNLPSKDEPLKIDKLKYSSLSSIDDIFNKPNSYAITISPKSSPVFHIKEKHKCERCGYDTHVCDITIMNNDEQYDELCKIIYKFKKKFHIDFLLFFEEYKNKKGLHIHGIINSRGDKHNKKMKDWLYDIFHIKGNNLLSFDKIKNYSTWNKYILKEQPQDKYYPLCSISRNKYNFKTNKKEQVDMVRLHTLNCNITNCNLCALIDDYFNDIEKFKKYCNYNLN